MDVHGQCPHVDSFNTGGHISSVVKDAHSFGFCFVWFFFSFGWLFCCFYLFVCFFVLVLCFLKYCFYFELRALLSFSSRRSGRGLCNVA